MSGCLRVAVVTLACAAAGAAGVAAQAERWIEAGADVGIVSLPVPHTPEPLAPIAEALAAL